jgi:ribosomal protein S18 acetylase RimI-like enzyme
MSVDSDAAASAVASTWQHMVAALPSGWIRRESGVIAGITGVALPTLNGAWGERADPDKAKVTELLDEIAATGLPYCLQLRPGASTALMDIPIARGMTATHQVPLMVQDGAAVLDGGGALETAQQVDGLEIHELAPEAAHEHATTAASGFEMPVELFLQMITPALLRLPGIRSYIGLVNGEPVATVMGVALGDFVAIFNVATPRAHRGQGYATALTARAVADGRRNGAEWAWLQSSPQGYGVYERLGFRTIERWDSWIFER